ncbi:MAG TPA: cupin domain-containing protein [Rhizomicrobium sp.]|jgi:quercetin dioxygenase-like cupin family protein
MNISSKSGRAILRAVSAAALMAATTFLGAGAANAAECPAGKVGVDVTKPGPMKPSGVTDDVIGSIDLKAYGSPGHLLRMRRLVVQPGGIVPWHSHGERPANILVVSGAITEYRSTCAVPIDHKAGDVAVESGSLAHWWKNNTNKPTVLISGDILPPNMSADSSM